jgi:type IV pilus assembly protein PilA
MFRRSRLILKADDGFTLIELLVVILIIGVLATLAIGSFLSQKQKADDASAKSLARTAATAAETVATENGGGYTSVTTSALNAAEPSLNIASNSSDAYLQAASGSQSGYSITVMSPVTSDTFTLQDSSGAVSRSCSGMGSGCVNSTW